MDAVRKISIVFGSLMMGALLGLIPFFFGRKRDTIKDRNGILYKLREKIIEL